MTDIYTEKFPCSKCGASICIDELVCGILHEEAGRVFWACPHCGTPQHSSGTQESA